MLALASMLSHAQAQQRETFTFGSPPKNSPPEAATPSDRKEPIPTQSSRDTNPNRISRDIAWVLSAEGDWNLQLQGQGVARITGNGTLIRATLEHEERGRPIQFFVRTDNNEIDHIYFTQTGDTPVNAAGIHSVGSNYLTGEGRNVQSLGANDSKGHLLNHNGFVRVDQRDKKLLINFSTSVVNCVKIERAPFTSQPPCGGKHFISTRPERTAQVHGCIVDLALFRANPEVCEQPFQIDRVTPTQDRENVNFVNPQLDVFFSERVKLPTLNNAFSLFTYSPSGDELKIPGQWRQEGPTQYRFIPEDPLYSGTIYLAEVEGGKSGVLSRNDAALEDDYEWSFSTMLNLAEQAPEDDDPVRLHNFQVVRDGELTKSKPTLTRAYIKWEKHKEVAQDMQPESFRMNFLPNVEYPRWVGQAGQSARVKSFRVWPHDDPELFTQEERRQARHTINFFGWRPSDSGTLEIDVEPYKPFPEPLDEARYTANQEYDVWSHSAGTLTMHYSFARVGAWRDGVPIDRIAFANEVMATVARNVAGFFPYRNGRAVMRTGMPPITQENIPTLLYDENGDPVPAPGSEASDGTPNQEGARSDVPEYMIPPMERFICALQQKLMPNPPEPPKDRSALQGGRLAFYLDKALADWYHLHRSASTLDAVISRGDVIVLFTPQDFLDENVGGYALGSAVYQNGITSFGFPGMRVQLTTLFPDNQDANETAQVILHEIAHEFGLEHNPGNARVPGPCPETGSVSAADLQGRNVDGIEAWRMSEDGLSGWNKSQEEGNGQVLDHTLVSIMWPFGMPMRYMSLTEDEYSRFQQSIRSGPTAVWQQSHNQTPHQPGLSDTPTQYASFIFANNLLTQRPAIHHTPVSRQLVTTQQSATPSDPLAQQLLIVGNISNAGAGLDINSISQEINRWETPAEGRYTAELLDGRNNVLASAPLQLLGPAYEAGNQATNNAVPASGEWMRFRVALPIQNNAAHLIIREGNRVRARLSASQQNAEIAPVTVARQANGNLALAWPAYNVTMRGELAYSPTGTAPWQSLSHDIANGHYMLMPDSVIPGPAPTVKFTVQNGPRFINKTFALPTNWPQRKAQIEVPEEGQFSQGSPVTLRFQTPMPWEELSKKITARNANGDTLELATITAPEHLLLSIMLANPADSEGTIRLQAPGKIQDVFGNEVEIPTNKLESIN